MHHPLLALLLVLVIAYLVMPARRKREQRNCDCQGKQLPPNLTAPLPAKPEAPAAKSPALPVEPKLDIRDANDESRLSQDEKVQLKQALALAQDVKQLEADFAAIRSRLTSATADGGAKATATSREVAIASEQVRIAKNYSNELMRFVMAPYQSSTQGQYVPSFSDASWAFTAGHLTLTFARARIVTLC